MNSNKVPVRCALLACAAMTALPLCAGAAEAKQAPSCGEWVVHREKSDTLALANASWLLGYLAGLAAGSGKDELAATDNAAIYKWIDAYCRKNPLRNLSSGAGALAAELGGRKGSPK